MRLEYIVDEKTKYLDIRQVLKNEFKMSDRLILKLKRENKIYCNDIPQSINTKLTLKDKIVADINFIEDTENIVPTKMDLDILYEDEGMLIINKGPNTPVHPSINHYEDSLSNGIKYYFNTIGLKRKIRPVNRLDKDTSGIVIFAKNEYVQECLVRQMKANTFEKEYLAIVDGIVTTPSQTIIAPIARKNDSIIERCVDESGDYAETIIELIQTYTNYSLVKCTLKTGRTHQIRVHTKHINHPILGDTLYGKNSNLITRQALHAYRINFVHPVTKQIIQITCEPSPDMLVLLKNKSK